VRRPCRSCRWRRGALLIPSRRAHPVGPPALDPKTAGETASPKEASDGLNSTPLSSPPGSLGHMAGGRVEGFDLPDEDEPLLEDDVPLTRVGGAHIGGKHRPEVKLKPQTRLQRWGVYLSISAYWFGWAMLWLPLLTSIIPSQVRRCLCSFAASFVAAAGVGGHAAGAVGGAPSLTAPVCEARLCTSRASRTRARASAPRCCWDQYPA
jgi:hypothetical protein